MRRPPHRRSQNRKVVFRPLLEIAEPRILLSISSRATASIVNTSTAGNQNSPVVAMDSNGDSIVVWKDASRETSAGGYMSDIRAQRYNPSGANVQKNGTTRGAQEFQIHSEADANFIERNNPAVAMDPAGDFVVAWVRNDTTVTGNYLYEVQARVFNAAGTALTSDINISSNTHVIKSQPAVAMDGSGNWVVTWTDQGSATPNDNDVFAKKFNLNGVQQTLNGSANALRVNAGLTTGNQFASSVGLDTAGDIVVTWTSLADVSGGDTEVYARQFNPTATVQGGLIHVNTTTSQGQNQAEVAVAPGGDFIIAWDNDLNDGTANRGDIFARRFNSDGSARSGEFQVNANALGFQTAPDVAIDANGNATVVWGNLLNSNGSDPGVFARRVNAQGTPIEATDIRVAPPAGTDQDSPSVAVDSRGDAAFAYRQVNGTGASTDTDIYAHFYAYVNDAPTLDSLSNLTVAQDSGTQTVSLSGIAAGGRESQTLSVAATSSNPGLIVDPGITYTSQNSTGSLSFTPTAGASGTAIIVVTVTDNGGTANGGTNTFSRQFTVTVVGKPAANAQSLSVPHNTAKAITLTGTDPNSPPRTLTFALGTSPTHGTLSGFNAATGAVVYTPNLSYQGADSFTFTVSNGTSTSAAATISLTVAPGTPTANGQSVTTNQDTAKGITLTGSDPDVPSLSLSYAIGTGPAHGTLTGLNTTTGVVTYTPNAGYSGPDSFTFTASNGINTSAAASVSITVNTSQTAPSITANPADQSVIVGQTATFTASATGTPTPTVQWQVSTDGGATFTNISGATSTTHSFATTIAQSGSKYRAVFTNAVGSATTTAATLRVQQATISSTAGVAWGSAGTATLQTDADGVRLLPEGRTTDLPWLGINKIILTLDAPEGLTRDDVSVTGLAVANYGPVQVSVSGTTVTITLAQPINAADRVAVTVGNANIATFTRRLDVLPGDVNDDGVVNTQDGTIIRNEYSGIAVAIPAIFLDINGDGVIDVNDFNASRQRIGRRLP